MNNFILAGGMVYTGDDAFTGSVIIEGEKIAAEVPGTPDSPKKATWQQKAVPPWPEVSPRFSICPTPGRRPPHAALGKPK